MKRSSMRRAGGVLKRALFAGVAGIVALSMAFSTPLVALATGSDTSAGKVTLDKTATALDENDQTDVTLSIGATEEKENVAVMFLLDKSTSQGMRDEAADMLNYLKTQTNTNILYNVVIFSGTATSTGWRNIQDDAALDDTLANFANKETTSGTNMDAGIERAFSEMATLPTEYENTYLVTLSDGITYVWSDDGEVKCVPIQGLGANGQVENTAQNGADTWAMMYGYGTSLADIYGPGMSSFLTAITSKIANTGADGHVQNYYGDSSLANPISTYIYDKEANNEVAAKYATGIDFAIYQSATGYAQLESMFTNSYAFAVPEQSSDGSDNLSNWDNYPWGKELMEYCNSLSSNAGYGEVSNADAAKVFEGIRNEILHEIESGVVTDYIGADFDLASLESFTMTVGSQTLKGTVNADARTVTFGDSYVVTYHPATANEGEYFTWEVNTPVGAANPITLTYTLDLVNKSTVAGTYEVPTNKSAVLDYISHDGSDGSQEFPVPTVTYTINPEVTGGFVAKKNLEGGVLEAGQFTFQVKDAAGNVVDEVTNDADGKIAFTKNMTFNEAGQYVYSISEVNGGKTIDGVTYDDTVYSVTVDVRLEGNDLVAMWYGIPEGGMSFNNAAHPAISQGPSTDTDRGDSGLPSTGDPTSVMALGTLSVIGLGSGAAGLILRRRSK